MSEEAPKVDRAGSNERLSESKVSEIKTAFEALESELRAEYKNNNGEDVPTEAREDSRASNLNIAFGAFATIIGLLNDGEVEKAKSFKESKKFSKISPDLVKKVQEILK